MHKKDHAEANRPQGRGGPFDIVLTSLWSQWRNGVGSQIIVWHWRCRSWFIEWVKLLSPLFRRSMQSSLLHKISIWPVANQWMLDRILLPNTTLLNAQSPECSGDSKLQSHSPLSIDQKRVQTHLAVHPVPSKPLGSVPFCPPTVVLLYLVVRMPAFRSAFA